MALTRRQIERFVETLEPDIAAAFLSAVSATKNRADIAALERAIQNNNLEAALRAAGIRPGNWSLVAEAARAAYIGGGQFTVSGEVPARFKFQFDVTNPRVLDYLAEHSAGLIVEISTTQAAAVRTTMSSGMAAGRNPRSIALDIVGRVGATGRRQGGVIGLHEQFAGYAENARRYLETGDNQYFNLTRRDRRFDSQVRKAFSEGRPIPQSALNRIVGRYEDRLLQARGTNIARTEAVMAYSNSSDEAMRQVVEEGLAQSDAVMKVWRHSRAGNDRPGHVELSGTSVPLGQPFVNPLTGNQLQFPGGGPAEESVNCRCLVTHSVAWERTEL